MKDVRLDIDAVPGLAHGVQFGFVEVIAILDYFDLVVAGDLGVDDRLQFVQECRRVNWHRNRIDQGIAQSRGKQPDQHQDADGQYGDSARDAQGFGTIEFSLE